MAAQQHKVDNQPSVAAVYPWENWSNVLSGKGTVLTAYPCWCHPHYGTGCFSLDTIIIFVRSSMLLKSSSLYHIFAILSMSSKLNEYFDEQYMYICFKFSDVLGGPVQMMETETSHQIEAIQSHVTQQSAGAVRTSTLPGVATTQYSQTNPYISSQMFSSSFMSQEGTQSIQSLISVEGHDPNYSKASILKICFFVGIFTEYFLYSSNMRRSYSIPTFLRLRSSFSTSCTFQFVVTAS